MSTSGQTLACLPSVCIEEPEHASACAALVGNGAAMRRLRLQIERIAPHFRTVLVRGEMGTGKELVARALHERSSRAAGHFVVCHAASLDVRAEAEERDFMWGRVHFADAGTLFIDGAEEFHGVHAVQRERTQRDVFLHGRSETRQAMTQPREDFGIKKGGHGFSGVGIGRPSGPGQRRCRRSAPAQRPEAKWRSGCRRRRRGG